MKTPKTKTGKRLISLLLTAAMLITAYQVPTQAETSPANPVHHCTGKNDGTDYTNWSYVYFGSYPQTEVTGSALTSDITGASYDANGDAWVGGVKYRRMKKSDANYSSTSSGYFSWNGENDYHYFKWERIRWRVLSNDGSTLFVAADRGLDCKDYHDPGISITWENCTLRSWLNSSFYNTAFSSAEQGAIISQNVMNEDNPCYGKEGGNNTMDNVYLLSIGEVTDPSYGFCKTYNTYSASRRLKPSDYAHARGAWTDTDSDYAGNCYWWLRSPGFITGNVAGVDNYGYVNRSGSNVNYSLVAVVPALHINLSSDLWSMADDGSSGEGGGSGSGDGGETGTAAIPVDSQNPSEVAKAVAFDLKSHVSDISGEEATIYGPSIDVFGKKFSLFEINASTKIGMDNLKAEVSYDVENKLVKVLVGVDTSGTAGIDGTTDNRMCNATWSAEYNQFKNLYKQMTGLEAKKSNGNGTYWNQFEKLKGKMNKFQCKLMVDASMWASGYMEWSYESGKLKFSEGGFIEQAALGVELKQNIPSFPLCYWFIKVTADEKGSFLFRQEGEAVKADFSLTPSLAAKFGIGMGKSEGKFQTYLEGSMDAVLAATIANKDPKLKVTLNGNLYAKGFALGYEILDKTFPFPEWQIYPQKSARSLRAARSVSLGDAGEIYQDASPLERDYLQGGVAEPLALAESYLYQQDGVFPYCEPQLFSLSGGRLLLVMVGDDGTKSLKNRTSLMYTIYEDGGWSDLAYIAEDGVYEDGIVAAQEGDKVYLTYRKADREFSDEATLEEMAAGLDLYETTFDGTGFSAPTCFTEQGNGVLESGQMLYVDGDKLTVAWQENTENDIFLTSGTNSIHMKTLQDGVWSEEVTALQTEDVISEIILDSLNGKTTLIYGLQKNDGTSGTEVYQYADGTAARILEDMEEPCEFAMAGGKLYFLNKDVLYSYDGTGAASDNISGISNYQILSDGDKSWLLTNVPGASGSELYLAEKERDAWGELRQFTALGGYIRDYDGALQDGRVVAAVNRLLPDVQEEGNYKDAALLVTGEEEAYDLAADYVYYEEMSVRPGEKLPLEIGMTNRGKSDITKIKAVVKDENGNVLAQKNIACQLKAQESMTLLLEYDLPQQMAQKKISVELSIPEKELTEDNNAVSTEIHYIDLAVQDVSCSLTADNEVLVKGTLANLGLEDIENVHTGIYDSVLTGEKLDEFTTELLRAGESVAFERILPEELSMDEGQQLNGLMLYVQSDAEERNYVNNEARLVYNSEGEQINPEGNDDPNRGGSTGTLDTEQKWEDDPEEDAKEALAAAKNAAIQQLETYKDAKDYRQQQKEELSAAIEAGKAAIESAEDASGVETALASAKSALDKIKTDAQLTEEEKGKAETELREAKETAVKELEEYKDPKNYREDQKQELSNAIESARAAIESAKDKESVEQALSSAKALMDKIKTDA